MPSLGADMESAEVTEWLVKPGTPVKKGDVIVVVETHKGAIEDLVPIFRRDLTAIVVDGDRFLGLITRIDLLNHLRRGLRDA